MIKGFIFDLDGTLLDTLDDLTVAINKVLAKHNFPQHSSKDVKEMIGSGAEKLVERALPKQKISAEQFNIIYKEFMEVYKTSQDFTKIYGGLPEVLDYLSQENIKIAVATNKPDNASQICKNQYLSKWQIDPFFGIKDGVPTKPNPFMLNKIIEIWGFEKSEVIFVGDSPEDMETAKNAGVSAIGVGWGFRSLDQLIKSGATFTVEDTGSFLRKVKELRG